MSNYSASALQPHIAYGASNAHAISVHANVVAANATLVPVTFQPLPLGSIKPEGWLHDQLSLMSDGLAGHEYDFYHYVHDSSWLGGHSEYSSLNEGFPYWFNGLVALAYGLDDARLKTQVLNAASYVQQHQQSDGWLGPETTNSTRDLWARFPYFLGLSQLVEADPTQASATIPAMYRFINLMHGMLIDNIGFTQFWGQVRYQDMLITLQWLYENHPIDSGKDNKQLLIETMYLLKQRSYDWSEYYSKDVFIFEDLDLIQPPITGDSPIFPFVHGVNTGQGLKANAVVYRFTANQSLLQTTRDGVGWTMQYHSDSAGTIIADERQVGLAPNRGAELCTAVETMFSFSYLYQVMGDNNYADSCERLAFNALPVSITPNHWARQYVATSNAPFARHLDTQSPFWNVGQDGIIMDLEPNYPCCTVNMPQGLPKYLSASYVKVGKSGLGHALLGPATVKTTLGDGTQVTVTCNTNYPFGDSLSYDITSSEAFDFSVRVPAWAASSTTSLNHRDSKDASPDQHTGMSTIHVPAGQNSVQYTLGAKIQTVTRSNDTVAVYYGALLYALDVGQTVEVLPPDGPPNPPPQVHAYNITATLPWNIAIDPTSLTFHRNVNSTGTETLANPIWASGAPPISITARGCQIDWSLDHGIPARVPLAPRTCTGQVMNVTMRPYGSLNVHMAELPTIDLLGKEVKSHGKTAVWI